MTTEKDKCKKCSMAKNEQDEELHYLLRFAKEADFSEEISCLQLKALWTAYCLHKNLDVDTIAYDKKCKKIWDAIRETEPDTAHWSDPESFDLYVGEFLA